ncbi:Transcription factor [Vigna unguiculata]|uniref:GATA transcription factor n=1 Tax=Vigna unguiculata TaxID=3917 RepID=A0A4D6N7S8_VIGUN|nr:Transcription factor [Vigna unguiculata]
MECLEEVLKSSFRKEMALKLSPQAFPEDLNMQNVTSCDDFFVDDLLDFSLLENEEPDQHKHSHHSTSVSPHNNNNHTMHNCKPSFNDNFNAELTLPVLVLSSHFALTNFSLLFSPKSSFLQAEEVADLEWVSHFIEDSFSKYSLSFPATVTQSLAEKPPEPGNAGFTFKTLVPAKPRSKRTRTGVRVWPLRSPSYFTNTSSPFSPLLICAATSKVHRQHPEDKRAKKRAASDGGAARRCSHCGVQKTPQWRTGPLGAKTLCNACGVRYKSGRLLPEYRPACSPTFSSELHSNHHRKVLEMRQKKEAEPGPDTGSPPSVPGF